MNKKILIFLVALIISVPFFYLALKAAYTVSGNGSLPESAKEITLMCNEYAILTDTALLEQRGYTIEGDTAKKMNEETFIIGTKKFCLDEDYGQRCSEECFIETKVRTAFPKLHFEEDKIICSCPIK